MHLWKINESHMKTALTRRWQRFVIRQTKLAMSITTMVLISFCRSLPAAEPTTMRDQTFPLIQLPMEFHAKRQSTDTKLVKGQTVEIFRASGSGCVWHMWIVPPRPRTGSGHGRRPALERPKRVAD